MFTPCVASVLSIFSDVCKLNLFLYNAQVLVIEEKLFTLEMVDDSIRRLNLRLCDGDKPSPLTGISLTARDSNLRQHGMSYVSTIWLSVVCPPNIINFIPRKCLPNADVQTYTYITSIFISVHVCIYNPTINDACVSF